MTIILVCDESGAKGFASQTEQFPGEVGVMAGYLLRQEQLPTVADDLDGICLPFRKADGKLHITELDSQAPVLRATIYDYLRSHNIPILFEAIHVQGFHEFHREVPDARHESLHTAIAIGIFTKAIAYAIDASMYDSLIQVVTDRVDPPLLHGFFDAYQEFLNDDPVVEVRRRRHRDPEQRTRAWLATQISWPDGFDAESFHVAGYSVGSDVSNSGLTVAADVLAGDLAYFFKSRRGIEFAGPLGTVGALNGHALADLCYGLTMPDGVPSPCDSIFQHPVQAARTTVRELLDSIEDPQIRASLTEMVRVRAYMIHVGRAQIEATLRSAECQQDSERLKRMRRFQAHLIRLAGSDELAPEVDWRQAREEFGIPANLWL